jgi:cyclopropane-fatty-acyl-phospholipid synthase
MTLAKVFEKVTAGENTPVEFAAYDGSRAGSPGSDIRMEIRTPYAVSYLVRSPGLLGLARAYVAGHIDVHGDMYTALTTLSETLKGLTFADRLRVAASVADDPLLRAAAATRVKPPAQEVRPGRFFRHSKQRDAEAIKHHYDVSNKFYEWVLGPSMAYTCAVYERPDATLEEAQYAKFDLVARKLGLEPGMKLLDVGCGWGGMVMHAAREYGVQALGVTLSQHQAEWAQKAIVAAGLTDLAEVRFMDYRDVPEAGFDAVSSIGLTEHIGQANVAAYFAFLHRKLKPGGRMLNHCITRPDNTQASIRREGFINRYVFPDGELEGPGFLLSEMHDNGFEVRHEENLREHYAMTLRDWCKNLDDNWDDAVAEVGEATARVWRLYMAGCRLGFDRNFIQLHQVLGVKLPPSGVSGMPLRPNWGS